MISCWLLGYIGLHCRLCQVRQVRFAYIRCLKHHKELQDDIHVTESYRPMSYQQLQKGVK